MSDIKLSASIQVSIQPQSFDIGIETAELNKAYGDNIGAIASFSGLVRAQEKSANGSDQTSTEPQLLALDIEHYPAMTQSSIEAICQTAQERWPFTACKLIHRVGRLEVGQPIVMVLVLAKHRKEAFAACEFMMDYLKTSAPFWKKAIFNETEHWVDAKTSDTDALKKWNN